MTTTRANQSTALASTLFHTDGAMALSLSLHCAEATLRRNADSPNPIFWHVEETAASHGTI
eukprot:2673442-Lingulodinium_polyedra.AAC.1